MTEQNTDEIEFRSFPKIARLSKSIIVTEKIDGTNGQIFIKEDGTIFAGSRNRWVTPDNDNFGFAAWVADHKDELLTLGPGRHFGEWWGLGIQRGYGLAEKKFSLFNIAQSNSFLPACCTFVPILYHGQMDTGMIELCLDRLREHGSVAAPGFMKPEGIIVFHTGAHICFKKTLDGDCK